MCWKYLLPLCSLFFYFPNEKMSQFYYSWIYKPFHLEFVCLCVRRSPLPQGGKDTLYFLPKVKIFASYTQSLNPSGLNFGIWYELSIHFFFFHIGNKLSYYHSLRTPSFQKRAAVPLQASIYSWIYFWTVFHSID